MLPAYYNHDVATGTYSTETDYDGHAWRLHAYGDVAGREMHGWFVAPVEANLRVWNQPTWSFGQGSGFDFPVSPLRPFGFVNFGHQTHQNDMDRARAVSRVLWEGMQGAGYSNEGPTYRESHFFGVVPIQTLDTRLEEGVLSQNPHYGNLLLRSLLRRGDPVTTVYMNNGRNTVGESNFSFLSHVFGGYPFDLADNQTANLAHLFANHGSDYGPVFTRRDLLDAMEVMCQVALSVPDADTPPPAPTQPVVRTMSDIGAVQIYADRMADRIDDLARRQVVQEVPEDVVRAILGEPTALHPTAGAHGDLIRQLVIALRRQGDAPRDIAAALRDLSSTLTIMGRSHQAFKNDLAIRWLALAASLTKLTYDCVASAIASAGASCGLNAVIGVLETAMAALAAENIGLTYMNQFDQFVLRMQAAFDLIDAKQVEMLNSVDEVRRILGQLRSARIGGQSALAMSLFADSDAAGRHYPVNTAMRRVYDINLRRYRAAHQAAVRTAAVARMAVEQRFGVDLETQTCASLVDPPSLWAADVCNTSGINYAELRDPNVEIGEDAIRQMFVGDYVRRLEHYTESYRFDFPYTSGEDLMVVSVRDDLVQPRGRCSEPAENLLGASNDLNASLLPPAPGVEGSEGGLGWHVPAAGCDSDPMTGETFNCIAIRSMDGPRIDTVLGAPGPVPGRVSGQSPRGFDVVFAPNAPTATSHFTPSTAWVQTVVLPGGVYRLSWYARSWQWQHIEARTDLETPSTADVFMAAERPMTDGWVRRFAFFAVPVSDSGILHHVGLFAPDLLPVFEYGVSVAGIQLEDVTGSAAAAAWADELVLGNEAAYGPGPFVATTAPGWAEFEDCRTANPAEFQNAWAYQCAQLCSGGFGSEHCAEGEDAQTFCYWETVFSVDEERLVGRGQSFGGGFAFGNFNYRTGDIAVNVVGTGVRDCSRTGRDACYTTAGIPFSLYHGAPGFDGDLSAYTVRTHTGALHPVHLFRGQIETGRALAAERYLTNPLSSADASLLADYQRSELRGRPMTGTYRLVLWDVPGLEFHRVEDVQILWRYRYFTRTGTALVCE